MFHAAVCCRAKISCYRVNHRRFISIHKRAPPFVRTTVDRTTKLSWPMQTKKALHALRSSYTAHWYLPIPRLRCPPPSKHRTPPSSSLCLPERIVTPERLPLIRTPFCARPLCVEAASHTQTRLDKFPPRLSSTNRVHLSLSSSVYVSSVLQSGPFSYRDFAANELRAVSATAIYTPLRDSSPSFFPPGASRSSRPSSSSAWHLCVLYSLCLLNAPQTQLLLDSAFFSFYYLTTST
jgi:hypothetical protein